MELMIVIAIIGLLARMIPTLYLEIRRFFFLNNTRITLQREARASLEVITRSLRKAQSATLVIDSLPSQPVYSRVSFTDVNGRPTVFYQKNKNLFMVTNLSTSTLTTNLRYLAFALPRSDDQGIVSVSLTLEKTTFESRTKALHMASEKVLVAN